MRRLDDLFSMKGRVALITGGAGHIGLAFGQALTELGCSVAVVDRFPEACDARARELAQHGRVETIGIAADLASETAPRAAVEATLSRFGRLDVIVHNAAYTGDAALRGYAVPFDEQSVEAWTEAFRVNLTAAFLLAQASRDALESSGHGSIVNVASIYGSVGPDMGIYRGTTMGNPAAYGASKGGLVQLTRYLATVLAPKIRVNAISPGGIERGQATSFVERYAERTPLARMGREEDLKAAVAFLASDASSYVTGHNLLVDGGWTVW